MRLTLLRANEPTSAYCAMTIITAIGAGADDLGHISKALEAVESIS
jgi:hypothetical protein